MNRTFFIAEVSSNHHRDLERCFNFIDTAAQMGCDAVKFQLFKIDRLFAPEVLVASEQHRNRAQWELPPEYLPRLASRCRQQKIAFACSPFDLEAVDLLQPHVAFFKIASYELLWHDLLRKVAQTGIPVILSTGMADLAEVKAAVDCLDQAGQSRPTLLHCSSAYPTPADQANLAAIETLRQATGLPVGWSDHSRDPAVIYRAVHRWGAETVEFHLDLEGEGGEFGAGHCWLPQQMAPVIKNLNRGLSADGDGRKQPNPAELPDRMWRTDPVDGLRPLRSIRDHLNMEDS